MRRGPSADRRNTPPQGRTASSLDLDLGVIAVPLGLSPPTARIQEWSKMVSGSTSTGSDRDPKNAVALFQWQSPSPIPGTWNVPPGRTTRGKCPTSLMGESRAKAVGLAGYAPTQPITLGVVACKPRRPENAWRRGCQDKKQADLLPMVPGDDESEGLGLGCHLCQYIPVETKDRS